MSSLRYHLLGLGLEPSGQDYFVKYVDESGREHTSVSPLYLPPGAADDMWTVGSDITVTLYPGGYVEAVGTSPLGTPIQFKVNQPFPAPGLAPASAPVGNNNSNVNFANAANPAVSGAGANPVNNLNNSPTGRNALNTHAGNNDSTMDNANAPVGDTTLGSNGGPSAAE